MHLPPEGNEDKMTEPSHQIARPAKRASAQAPMIRKGRTYVGIQTSLAALGRGIALSVLSLAALLGQASAQVTEPDSLREMFRDWAVNCETIPADPPSGPGTRICEMVQQVDHQETGQRVLAFSVRLNEAGQPVAVVIAPFGLRLSEGLRVRIGDAEVAQMPFETCLPEGCLVVAPLDQSVITAMQGATEGAVVLLSRTGEAVAVPMSFLGFTAALERLRALSES